MATALVFAALPVLAQDTGNQEGASAETDAVSGALTEMGDAARDLGAALFAGAQSAWSSTEKAVAEAGDSIDDKVAESVTVMALSTAGETNAVSDWLKQEEIVNRDGIDFDKAFAAIDASDMTDTAKDTARKAIEDVRSGLDQVRAGLSELNGVLNTDS